MRWLTLALLFLLPLLVRGQQAPSLPSPGEGRVLANATEEQSRALARHYAGRRGIPESNIVALNLPADETVTWQTYVSQIQNPLRRWLHERHWINDSGIDEVDPLGRTGGVAIGGHRIGYLVLCKGVPLRIDENPAATTPASVEAFVRMRGPQGETLRKQPGFDAHLAKSHASVDSELAGMLLRDNPLLGSIPNPLYRVQQPGPLETGLVIKVARLDGPSYAEARRLVDDALAAERLGLRGRAYIDAGGPYPLGNQWLEQVRNALETQHWDVTVERTKERFPQGVRFDAPALYFGWHSSRIEGPFTEPGFRFPPGAVAVHLHSFSAATLRDPGQQWTGPLVTRGAAATIGNVYEPTLGFTHNLDVLGLCTLLGWSWGDAAYCAMPVLSWQGVVIGDPLYVPLKVTLQEQVRMAGDLDNLFLGQYPIIRAMRALEAQGRRELAIETGRKAFDERPGMALALEITRLRRAAGDSKAVDSLRFAPSITYFTFDDQGVALEIARTLAELGESRLALELLGKLRAVPKPSEAFRQSVKAEGLRIATALGDIVEMQRWATDEGQRRNE